MGRSCQQCGGTEIDEDAARGDAICMGCGAVLEESIVVLENQFQERAGGSGHTLVGQFVTIERQGPQGASMGQQDSREVTFYKGKKLIEEVASQLRVNQHCMDTAFNFFKMCVCRNLTRGRPRTHVVAACLYMTCRLENTAHLLLDFSDITQVNVFDLGRTLNFLSRSLRINLPTTDPCLYILRFAVLLDFGPQQKEIVTLATRLVQRMKRDWLATGRRPTGLCGAALLLAARAYNFNRTVSDIVRIVHVSEQVVRKRLDEFSQTPSAGLTVDEFATVDLEHAEDPPAFRESRKKAREEQLMKEELEAENMEKELVPLEEELEKSLEKKRKEKFKKSPYAKMIGGDIGDPDMADAQKVVQNEIIDEVFNAANEAPSTSAPVVHNPYAVTSDMLGIDHSKNKQNGMQNGHSQPQMLNQSFEREDGELVTDDIDDDEINTYILTQAESEMKEKFWMRCNGEHVKEMDRRRQERLEQEEKDRLDPTKKKKKKAIRRKEAINASDPLEAIEKIIHEKRLSNKVNYDILKEIEKCDEGLEKPSFMTMEDIGKDPSAIIDQVNRLVCPKLEMIDKMESPSMEFAMGRPEAAEAALNRLEERKKRRGERKRTSVSFQDMQNQFVDLPPNEDMNGHLNADDVDTDDDGVIVTRVPVDTKAAVTLAVVKDEKKCLALVKEEKRGLDEDIVLERVPPKRGRFARVKPIIGGSGAKKVEKVTSSKDNAPSAPQQSNAAPDATPSSATLRVEDVPEKSEKTAEENQTNGVVDQSSGTSSDVVLSPSVSTPATPPPTTNRMRKVAVKPVISKATPTPSQKPVGLVVNEEQAVTEPVTPASPEKLDRPKRGRKPTKPVVPSTPTVTDDATVPHENDVVMDTQEQSQSSSVADAVQTLNIDDREEAPIEKEMGKKAEAEMTNGPEADPEKEAGDLYVPASPAVPTPTRSRGRRINVKPVGIRSSPAVAKKVPVEAVVTVAVPSTSNGTTDADHATSDTESVSPRRTSPRVTRSSASPTKSIGGDATTLSGSESKEPLPSLVPSTPLARGRLSKVKPKIGGKVEKKEEESPSTQPPAAKRAKAEIPEDLLWRSSRTKK